MPRLPVNFGKVAVSFVIAAMVILLLTLGVHITRSEQFCRTEYSWIKKSQQYDTRFFDQPVFVERQVTLNGKCHVQGLLENGNRVTIEADLFTRN